MSQELQCLHGLLLDLKQRRLAEGALLHSALCL